MGLYREDCAVEERGEEQTGWCYCFDESFETDGDYWKDSVRCCIRRREHERGRPEAFGKAAAETAGFADEGAFVIV